MVDAPVLKVVLNWVHELLDVQLLVSLLELPAGLVKALADCFQPNQDDRAALSRPGRSLAECGAG